MFKKNKLPILLIIAVSCISVIVLSFIYIIFMFNWGYVHLAKNIEMGELNDNNEYLFVNKDNMNDPYITKNPRLKDIINGPIINKADPGMGDEKAFVYIVQYSDFECNYCAEQEQVLKRVLQKYSDKVRFIWKDYPKSDYDSASYQAAIAARCAQQQDKFWPYHDFLYMDNKELKEETYLNIAQLLELDMRKFDRCLGDDSAVRRLIDNNIEEANALAISGVPFLYINSQEIMGEVSEEELERMINIELDKNK